MKLATRLAIAMILLVTVVVSTVAWLSYRNVEEALLPRVLERIETHARLIATGLESYVSAARNDIVSYNSTASLDGVIRAHSAGGIDPLEHVSEKTWRHQLASNLRGDLEVKPAYTRYRLIGIDDNAREMVRVDRTGPNGSVRIVANPDLKQIGDEAYFRETIKLRPGEIYVSPIGLDRDNGIIDGPPIPMLRVATPIFAPDETPFGILVLDIDMRPAFDIVRSSPSRGAESYVIDARGDYLVHPDPNCEFGSKSAKVISWQKDFPYLVGALGTRQSMSQIVPDPAGRQNGIALAPAILAGSEWVAVIETLPNEVAMAPAVAIQNTSILVGLIAVICAAVMAALIARSLTRPIVQLTAAVEGIGRNDPVAIPLDSGGETGVLAHAFARVMGEANAKSAALEREVQEHRRTEAARDHYAERERLFSAAVESSNDAIVTKSLDGTITGWNPAAERLFGFTAEEAVGQNVNIIVPPDRLVEVHDILRRIAAGERIEHYETLRKRKDGSSVEVSLSISPIKSASGAIIGASKTARDIGERKRTERALSQQIEERRRIFETSQDLILVTDSKGVLVQISPSVEAILGYRPEELIGHSAVDFHHPDDLELARTKMRAARLGQHTQNYNSRYIHKDGRVVTLSWMGAWSEPVKRHFFVGRDMTESWLAQETLRESEQLARGIIDTASDAFVQIDEGGSILNWNPQAEKLFGWPREQALGKNALDLIVAGTERDYLKSALQHFLNTGESNFGSRREVMAQRRDGGEFKAELSVTALRRREGFVFNGFFRDLTEKIAAEERIRQAEKMEAVGQLTGGIAHDFNNILTVITGTIEILAGAVEKEPQLAAIAKMIDEAAARGAELTQHLLAFARKQPLQPRETDVNALIRDTTKLLRPTLGAHIQIETVFESETCVATVDPNQLTNALLNLALNARDAMPEGGKVFLETGSTYLDENYASMHAGVRPGRYVVIIVSDIGSGIPAALLDKVFDPFFTSKGPSKGTGLGLSMVYGFVMQSAGHIKIYSEEGHGTTIRMYLPPGTGTPIDSETVSEPAIQGGHETILVVEDDKLVRDYVLTQLHSLGYATLEAANAAEAIALVEAGHQFDLLFTDIMMPGPMNGRQLANAVRKKRPGTRVLFTSGYTENTVIRHGKLASGVLLLAKPYRKSDLAGMIRKALAG